MCVLGSTMQSHELASMVLGVGDRLELGLVRAGGLGGNAPGGGGRGEMLGRGDG